MTLEENSIHFIHVIISLAILLFAAKLFAELFHKLKLPVVLGELLAGIIVGPFAIGGLFLFNSEPLVELDETVRDIGEISAIVILFVAGLEITPTRILEGRSCLFYGGINWCYCSIFCWICSTDLLRVRGIRVYAGSYSTYGYKYRNICPSIDRTRKDADKRSQTDIRCSNSR